MTNTFLVAMIMGSGVPALAKRVSELTTQSGCHIQAFQLTHLADSTTITLQASGNWSALGKLEASLQKLASEDVIQILCHRCEKQRPEKSGLLYGIEIIAIDRRGILDDLIHFFSDQHIPIDETSAHVDARSPSSVPTLIIRMQIQISKDIHIATLREDFLTFCDTQNLDGIMEPMKP